MLIVKYKQYRRISSTIGDLQPCVLHGCCMVSSESTLGPMNQTTAAAHVARLSKATMIGMWWPNTTPLVLVKLVTGTCFGGLAAQQP